jgi:hypothetical protein
MVFCIAYLPATAGSQKVISDIELDPVTGALKSVNQGGNAFDPGLIGRVGTAAASVIDAEQSRYKAAAAENDPLALLKRKKEIMELQAKIKELQEDKPYLFQ